MLTKAATKTRSAEDQQLIADCLKQLAISPGIDLQAYLRSRKVTEPAIPAIIAQVLQIAEAQKTAKTRMQEGGVVTAIGLGGMAYAAANEKDSSAWLIWSVVGLGILANGWWKRKQLKQFR